MNNGIRIQYPYKTETRTGFVMFLGNNSKGKAKFSFVGTNNQHEITTLHTKTGKDFWKAINNNSQDKTIRTHNE